VTIEQCVSEREKLLILAGLAVIGIQQVLMWLERRYYRNRIAAYAYAPPPPPPNNETYEDRRTGWGGGDENPK